MSLPGAYIHVPYCAHRCSYCSFAAVTGKETEERYFDAVSAEIEARAREVPGPFDTVYLGGGTPSFARPGNLSRVLMTARTVFGLAPGSEITAEANPDDLSPEILDQFAGMGINRISIGVQSLFDAELDWLERRHCAASARRAVTGAVGTFGNVSADLMIGIPGQTLESLEESALQLLEAGITHLSVYLLEMEKAPRLVKLASDSPELFASGDEMADRWLLVDQLAEKSGLLRYEFSNWAKPGFESRHNTKYWNRVPVLGFGVSAHSFDGHMRQANSGSITGYLLRIEEQGMAFVSGEHVEGFEAQKEAVLLGLRLAPGVDDVLFTLVAAGLAQDDRQKLADARSAGLIERARGRIRLTREGVLLSNEILSAFV